MKKNRKILYLGLLTFILLFSFTGSTSAGFIDSLYQPHLSVVSYNESMEAIKHNLLADVSIYTDPELYRRWANMTLSIGIIVLLLVVLRVGSNLVLGKKDSMIKFIAFAILLFFLAGIYAPFFSGISRLLAGKESTYIDPETKVEYSRIYIPANQALVVNPVTVRGTDSTKESFNKILTARDDKGSFFSWERLGIPAKVVQTQWQTNSDPTNRYSTAFLGVSPEVLFSEQGNLTFDWKKLTKGIEKNGCTIEPQDFSTLTQGEGTPFSFLDAISKGEWQKQAEVQQGKNPEGKVVVKDYQKLKSDIVKFTKQDEESSTFHSQPIDIPVDECTLGYYLMSNQYLGDFRPLYTTAGKELIDFPAKNVRDFRTLLFQDATGMFYGPLREMLEQAPTYEDQKRILYTFYAYRTLFFLTQVDSSKEVKEKSQRIKEAALACGRILSDTIQSNLDFKTCLLVDQAGDITGYTQDASKEIGIAGKNKEVREGYVLPTPISIDWDYTTLSDSYGEVKSFGDDPLKGALELGDQIAGAIADGIKDTIANSAIGKAFTSIGNAVGKVKDGIYNGVVAIGNGIVSVKNTILGAFLSDDKKREIKEKFITDQFTKYGIDATKDFKLEIQDDELRKEIMLNMLGYLEQNSLITTNQYWYGGTFNPIVSSVMSYDLDGNGVVDREEYKSGGDDKIKEVKKYYAYHYGTSVPSLGSDKVFFLNRSFFEEKPARGITSKNKQFICKDSTTGKQTLVTAKGELPKIKKPTVTIPGFGDYIVNIQQFEGNSQSSIGVNDGLYFVKGGAQDKKGLRSYIINFSPARGNKELLVSTFKKQNFEYFGGETPSSTILYKENNTDELLTQKYIISEGDSSIGYLFESDVSLPVEIIKTFLLNLFPDLNRSNDKLKPGDVEYEMNHQNNRVEGPDGSKKPFYIINSNSSKILYRKGSDVVNSKNGIPLTEDQAKEWDLVSKMSESSGKRYPIVRIKKNEKDKGTLVVRKSGGLNHISGSSDDLYKSENTIYLNFEGRSISYYQKLEDGRNYVFSGKTGTTYSKVHVRTNRNDAEDKALKKQMKDTSGTLSDEVLTMIKKGLNTNNVTKGEAKEVESFGDGGSGECDSVTWKEINFDKLGKVFPGTGEQGARRLLDPRLNPPITYHPDIRQIRSEYEASGNYCLLNEDLRDNNRLSFEDAPKLTAGESKIQVSFNKCSQIGQHMRLTDLRLKTYVQDNGVLSVGKNKEVFTHYSVPLIVWDQIGGFNMDRKRQNYSGEAMKGDSIFGNKEVTGVKITEGDVFTLKPGVILGAYNHPFTLLVPTKVMPYLYFVETNNPTQKSYPSRVYSGGVYDWVTSLLMYLKRGEVQSIVTGGSVTPEGESQNYKLYLLDKYDSRPDALKVIEGEVPDRYFHAYYGDAYYNVSEAGSISQLGTMMKTGILGLMNFVVMYRVVFLEWLLIFSPLYVFCLLFPHTRKIFSFMLALTITLYILPVITIIVVNIFLG